jgi:16S rRNA (cytidine1402-2'-O)-methyltransferase
MPGTLFVVATPIGNLEDISARALRVLREATLIAAEDTRRTSHLLARYAITTPTTSLHEHNESTKAKSLVARLIRGDNIALVSDAGTPTISDPGQTLVHAAIAAGIKIEPIPGPNAAIAALAASGFATTRFTFFGFPPIRPKDRKTWLDEVRSVGGVAIFFEAPHRIAATLGDIAEQFGDRPIMVARELTKVHEEFLRGQVSAVINQLAEPKGEFTIVLDIGYSTKKMLVAPPSAIELRTEFCHMTNNSGLTRRKIISALAKKYHLSASEVYSAIEQAKKLGETTGRPIE